MDTQWADVSEFQNFLDNTYKLRGIAVRSNDGTYRDSHFAGNLAQAKMRCDQGSFDFFIVYFVYETNWRQTFETFKAMVGKPHPKMAVMIDVENWSGRITGDRSADLNALRQAVADWLAPYMSPGARLLDKHKKRVGGYANAGDWFGLWPRRPKDMWVVLANYSSNPSFPGKLAHQYSDRVWCPPFGHCDMNSADGMTPAQVVKALGVDPTPSVPKPKPTPVVPPKDNSMSVFIATIDQADCVAAKVSWPGMFSTDLVSHVTHLTPKDLANLRAAGVQDLPQPMSLEMYYALGGK